MTPPNNTYGTSRGRDVTEEDIERIVRESEAGYDPEMLAGSTAAAQRADGWSFRNGPQVDELYAAAS